MVVKIMDEQILQNEEQFVEESENLINESPEEGTPKKPPMKRETKRIIFYTLMMIFPMAQFLLFYVYINFSEIMLAFQLYAIDPNDAENYIITFSTVNFEFVFNFLFQVKNIPLVTNSVIYYVLHTAVGTTLALAFSYYIYKKYFLSELFRVILFLPQVISGLVLSLLFNYIVTDVYKELTGAPYGLMSPNSDMVFGTLIIYNLWLGFGTNILLYSGAMSGINDSIVESAHLDGVTVLSEFFYITFPMIFSTFSTFIITGVSGIFTQQLHLFAFFGLEAPQAVRTLGYYIYISTLRSGVVKPDDKFFSFGELSALGLTITLVVLPITFGVRSLLEKLGPTTE